MPRLPCKDLGPSCLRHILPPFRWTDFLLRGALSCLLFARARKSLTPFAPCHQHPVYACSEDVSFSAVLERFLQACLVPRGKVKALVKSLAALGERFGLDVTQFGGKECASGALWDALRGGSGGCMRCVARSAFQG